MAETKESGDADNLQRTKEVCNLCRDPVISFRFNELALCQRDRELVFRALLYDYWKAGIIGQMIDEFYQKGPKALDQK